MALLSLSLALSGTFSLSTTFSGPTHTFLIYSTSDFAFSSCGIVGCILVNIGLSPCDIPMLVFNIDSTNTQDVVFLNWGT